MIVTIPTNDRINIEQKSGRAKEFAFFDLDNLDNVNFEENPHKHHDHSKNEAHEHSHKTMIDMFKKYKVEAIIVDVVGKHFKNDLFDAKIKIYKTDLKNLKEIASSFKNNSDNFKEISE